MIEYSHKGRKQLMRFDYFDDLWTKYEEELNYLKVPREILKKVYNSKFSSLRKIGEEETYYKENRYHDQLTDVKYRSFTEGRFYIFPTNDSLTDAPKKSISVGESQIKMMEVKDESLFLEAYDYESKSITLKCYDKDALDYIKGQQLFGYANVDYAEDYLENAHILPDVEMKLTTCRHRIDDINDSYEPVSTYTVTYVVEKAGEVIVDDNFKINNPEVLYNRYQHLLEDINIENMLNSSKSK